MKHYILASHGRFAKGIYESVEIILGPQPNVHIVCGYIQGETDVKDEIADIISLIDIKDEIIACSDLLGGSVNNELMKYIKRENFHLITGMNLPLLMNLFLYKEENTKSLLRRILPEINKSITYCNENDNTLEEEDF